MLDDVALAPFAQHVLTQAEIPDLPNYYRGKVRENYDLPDGRRVLITTDRLSAFDRILCAVPFKGEVLTRIARHWFEATGDICPNHVLAYPDPNVVVARRLDILPVEMVVRGYLAGTTGTSVLTLYKAGQREMYGLRLSDGLRDNQRLLAPILTPTSKEFDGGHDAPLSPEQIISAGLLTRNTNSARTRMDVSCWRMRFTPRTAAATGARRAMRRVSPPASGRKVSTRISSGPGWRRAATRIGTRFRRSRAR
jgi:phosphoribosylaminoimidazole-succinocarboxamide synthase